MPLTLWTESGPGFRSEAFFKRIAASHAQHNRAALTIVPNLAWKLRYEALCLPHLESLLFGGGIITWHQWIEQMAGNITPLSPAARQQIVSQLMTTQSLAYFRGTSSAAVLIQGLESAMTSGISPAELSILAADFGQEREQDLAHLYEAYVDHLHRTHRMDPAQLPGLALAQVSRSLSHSRYIMDAGIHPTPVLWAIARQLAAHPDAPDVHVIVTEFWRHTAEQALGTEAREISPDEWIATSPPPPTLFRTPTITSEYRYMAMHLRDLLNAGHPQIAVMPCDPDPTFWQEACAAEGLLPATAMNLPLAASPISAPWHDARSWQEAPAAACIADWALWWRRRMAPQSRIQSLVQRIHHEASACRALQDVARWEEIWIRCMALVPTDQSLTPRALQSLVAPLLQAASGQSSDPLRYSTITLSNHVGDPLSHLIVLDAAQDFLPRVSPSPFFKLAASFPQDPNAQRLIAAFPNSERMIQIQMAAWLRLCACAQTITASYSQTSDARSEVFPSLFLDVAAQDTPISHAPTSPQPHTHPSHCLTEADTIDHARFRMRDHVFSITELEDFAKCPFHHFARYILGINIPDEETPEISPRDEGKLIHTLLEKYYRRPLTTLAGMADEEQKIAIHNALRTILAKEIKTTSPLHHIQTERLIALAIGAILHDLADTERQAGDALQPTHFEWKFGYHEIPPLELKGVDGSSVLLRGKVDRIDIHPTQRRLLVMDYKTGKVDPIGGEIQKGLHLQIPLYLMAAQKIFSDHVVLGGLLYDLPKAERRHGIAHKDASVFLGIPGRPRSLVKGETWDQLLDTAAQFAVQYVAQIRAADLPNPLHTCEYCDWKGLLPWEK